MKGILLAIVVLWGIISVNAQNRSFNLNEHQANIPNKATRGNSQAFNNAKKHRDFRINNRLKSPGLMLVNDTIVLDLFEDISYKACIEKISVNINNTYTILARILDTNYGHCIISTSKGNSFITIDLPEKGEYYKTKYNHKTQQYHLLEVDQSKEIILEGAPSLIPAEPAPKQKTPNNEKQNKSSTLNSAVVPLPLGDEATQDTVTLLIVYTPAAAAWSAANETDINNTISSIITQSQLALDNSNTLTTLELVHSAEVDYVELHSNDDLYNLTNNNDDKMDTVHAMRDNYCADLVVLLEETDFTGGLGWLYWYGSAAYGFSLTRVQQASWTYTTIHEIGHNMGCHHHKGQNFQPGPGEYDYSAGWRWTGTSNYCSVMTYERGSYFADGISHSRVPYFSNPLIQYQGINTGDAADADNARTIRELKGVVSTFRSNCVVPVVTPSNLLITDINYEDEDIECFNATQTITIGGTNTVNFYSGSTINLIAGESITFLPGFHAHSGSDIIAHITNTADFCDTQPAPIISNNINIQSAYLDEKIKDENLLKEKTVKVYPNPNNGQFKVDIQNFEERANIQIINSIGTLIYKNTAGNGIHEIELQNLNRGLYFMNVQSGQTVKTSKIIIQ